MLVLSRKKNESIVLDGQIEIQILKVKGNTVRLGIKAPDDIKVLRGELSPFNMDAVTSQSDSRKNSANAMINLSGITQEGAMATFTVVETS